MQYELEQYQPQQTQKAHHDSKHRSWISNPSGSKTTDQGESSKAFTAIGHASNGTPSSGVASRRISTPLPLSSLSNRNIPKAPLSLRSSEEDLSFLRGNKLVRELHGSQNLDLPERNLKTSKPLSPRFLRTLRSARVDYNGPCPAPLTTKPSDDKLSFTRDGTMHLPGSKFRARGCSLSSARQLSPSPSSSGTTYEEVLDTQSTIVMTPAKTATNRSHRSSYVMDGRIQQSSSFVHGQPSPPLEPDGFQAHVVDSEEELLGRMPSVSILSPRVEGTWSKEGAGQLDASDDVQQLIWETDEAFKAVSSALAEARQSSYSPDPVEKMRSPLQNLQQVSHALHEQTATAKRGPTVDEPQAVSPISPTPGAARGSVAPRWKASRAPPSLSSIPHIIKSPMSTGSVSKSKKGSITPKAKAMRSVLHESSASRSPRESPARGTGGHRPHQSYHKSISRLNLAADKVTDKLFEGRNGRFGFIRVEADEVVTPEQVELFKRNRIAKQLTEAERDISNDTLRGIADGAGDQSSSDADDEPCHPQDLASRIAHLGVDALSPVIEVATPDAFQLNKGFLGQMPNLAGSNTPAEATKEVKLGQDPLATPPPTPPQRPIDGTDDAEPMSWKTLGHPKLSHRRLGHKRSTSSTSHIASLPTIPEVKISTPQGWDVSRPSWQQAHRALDQKAGLPIVPTDVNGNPYFEEDEEHMFFMSNSVTTTMPTFQHGRIRLAKADLINAGTINSLESKLLTTPDETLDWTAFQMAILGGAGDLFSDPDNFLSRDAQEEMVDDLCDWLEDIGFSNGDLGALVTTNKPRRATAAGTPYTPLQTAVMSTPGIMGKAFYERKDSVDSRSSSVGSGLTRSGDSPDHSIPIPVEIEHPSGFWNVPQSNDADRFHTGPGLKRWTLEGHPKRYHGAGIDVNRANSHAQRGAGKILPRTPGSGGKSVRASIDSLPQSPMLELRMMTGVDGNKEFVSMGYNLNHDLGDFLKWESEHVYAPGFYGAE